MDRGKRNRSVKQSSRRGGSRSNIPWVLGGLLTLLVVGVLLSRMPGRGAAAGASDLPYPEVPRISVAEAKALHDEGRALLVDLRGEEAFQQISIPGSINLPYLELEARYSELPRDAQIITICT
ncbi:MAG: rhodanese-like domain-containing protein [Anaerolineae bacterium]